MRKGGASGLGLAVAERLVDLGARVVVLDLRPPVALPPGAAYVEADVGSEAAVDRAMGRGGRRALGLTLAVCCAGISHRGRVVGREGPMAQMDFARVVTANIIGTFLVCRAAATVMQHNDPEADGECGVIVNTASIAAFDGQIGQAAYAASKGGVVNLTLPLAREPSGSGSSASPRGSSRPRWWRPRPGPSVRACRTSSRFPKRFGIPAEFAALVCHIYENPMLNGAVIRLDGALRMSAK